MRQTGGAAAAGVATMYLFDPDRGAARRAKIRDQATHLAHEARDGADTLSRDLRNRVSGVPAGLRYRFFGGDADDAIVVERVRSQLGLVSGHAKAIDVSVAVGEVRLDGDALADEHDAVVRAVRRTPGVRSVDDRLRIHHSADGVSKLQGATRTRRQQSGKLQENWSPTTRLMSGVAGIGLMGAGRRLGGVSGLLLRGGGLAMATRAAANRPLGQVTGVGAGGDAVETEAAVTIDAPPDEVWPLVSDYPSFPSFMQNVLAVERLDDGVTRWTVRGMAGAEFTFDARETFRDDDGRAIGWRTLPDQTIAHAGDIAVVPTDGRTRVQVRMRYNPVGGEVGHGVAALLGSDPRHRMRADLLCLRDLVQSRKHDREPAAAST